MTGTANIWHRSNAGQKKYVNGQLVAKSIDIYLCMEYADGGDVRALAPICLGSMCLAVVTSAALQVLTLPSCKLKYIQYLRLLSQLFTMRGQLSAEEVRLLMWQVSFLLRRSIVQKACNKALSTCSSVACTVSRDG